MKCGYKSFISNHQDSILQIVLMVVIFILGRWRLGEVGQPILFNDEYGYWADSAYLMGQDWSSVTSRIGYYSYGYSLLLIPLQYLAKHFWWSWDTLYRSAVVLNAVMLTGSYILSVQICKRLIKDINWIVRDLLCFAAIVYPSNLIYAHITWTENTLTFVFWVFLFVLMRMAGKPTIWNHIGMAVISIYIYTVHQRALAIPITAVIIVMYMKVGNHNQLKHVAAFLGSMFACIVIHTMIKGGLQNDFYMGNTGIASVRALGETVGLNNSWSRLPEYVSRFVLTQKMLILLVAGLVIFVLLYLFEKGKARLAASILLIALIAGITMIVYKGDAFLTPDTQIDARIANNDFAGQWGKVKGIFTKEGLVRLGISIVGKWFYLASGTGLVICWGMRDLLRHGGLMILLLFPREDTKERKFTGLLSQNGDKTYNIWLFGVFLAWIGTYFIVAIYKEGIYKVDDLLHGRYNEFLIGVLFIYSFYSLIKDKKWYITWGISLLLYLVAGWVCQHTLDMQQNAVFELAHSTVLGKIFWNWEAPEGKIVQLWCYVLPLSILFIGGIRFGVRTTDTRKLLNGMGRQIVALMVPVLVWLYLSAAIVDGYVIKRNSMQAYSMPQAAMWIGTLDMEAPVYFLEDTVNYRYAEGIQFMLQEQPITLTNMANVPLTEDSFFIMGNEYARSAAVAEQCEIIYTSDVFSLLVNKDGGLIERWEKIGR